VRSRRYLDNIVEQDHRASKRRCASMLGFKSFRTTAITPAGIRLIRFGSVGTFVGTQKSDKSEKTYSNQNVIEAMWMSPSPPLLFRDTPKPHFGCLEKLGL
jgi:transposase-like protein